MNYLTRNGRSKYTVKKGDSLSIISQNLYGNMSVWPLLATQNKIRSPYNIQVGQTLLTPPLLDSRKQVVNVAPARAVKAMTPTAKDPCEVKITIKGEDFKNLMGKREPIKVSFEGSCLKAEISLDGSLTIKRKNGKQCVGLSSSGISTELDSSKKLNSYLEDVRNIEFEYNPKEGTLGIKPTQAMKINSGNSSLEIGLGNGLELASKDGKRIGTVSIGGYMKSSLDFDINDLNYTISFTVEIKLTPGSFCGKPQPTYRFTAPAVATSFNWNRIGQITVVVVGGVLVIAGVIYAIGAMIAMGIYEALALLVSGFVKLATMPQLQGAFR